MLIKTIIDEDFTNYKKPSMFVGTCVCNWKCCVENNLPITTCQNQPLSQQKNIEFSKEDLYKRYSSNLITQSFVFGGLEPFLQFEELLETIKYIRQFCNDDVVIYTGYYPNEIQDKVDQLKQYENIIIKFGRFVPNQRSHYDSILGVNLVSDNQYAEKIS